MTSADTVARSRASGAEAERLKRLATYAAVAVAGTLIAIKLWAWVETHSVAMLASLVDSTLDLVASGLNLVAVRHALTPADEEHRFGHGKAEALAGLGQAAFIGGSAAFLLFQSLERLVKPEPVHESTMGLVVIGVSLVLTLALVLFQRYVIARTRSLAISADRLHYATDIATNLGVVAALVLAGLWGWTIADPLIGLAISLVIAWGAFSILRGSYDELMDREFDDAERARIKDIVGKHSAVVSLHDLRTRRAGHRSFIQLHLELPPTMTLIEAHRTSDEVEDAIRAAFPDAEVLTHQDPAGVEMVPTLAKK
ncbi:MAG: cation diffusion facilitator family transporter [Alphaproteobacteria bacterium]|nr:cation diffusion facilitator family transporter [Alphaproteobacteria bacterium]